MDLPSICHKYSPRFKSTGWVGDGSGVPHRAARLTRQNPRQEAQLCSTRVSLLSSCFVLITLEPTVERCTKSMRLEYERASEPLRIRFSPASPDFPSNPKVDTLGARDKPVNSTAKQTLRLANFACANKRCATLEATQGQILSQSPTEATSGR